ncbi:MAG TPA: riboflavin synthase [Symbiobacteriaceae bacterium]|nr:riboflavin synthase [Symbiobacteriaceae bacterium]
MFTGLVEETGTVQAIRRAGHSLRLTVGARRVLEGARIGDSIAVNGVCLTVVELANGAFTADAMPETFAKTNLGDLSHGAPVNLERTMALGDRFGGHIVQGHADGTGTIMAVEPDEIAVWVTVGAPPEVLRYLVPKGSVAIDGISLTVVDVGADRFRVSLIPHTWQVTTMSRRRPGARVNLECDILAKYVERLLGGHAGQSQRGITPEFLREHGF